MGDKTVSVRVRFEGGQAVKAGLQEVGREGSRAIESIGAVSSQTGARLQNAGYQVSDFFVQVAGGTAPTRALAQQLPQLLQGFGLIGVAASVLIAALPSLWSLFSSGASDAEALDERLKTLTETMRAWNTAAQAAERSEGNLLQEFGGENVEQAQRVLEIQRQIAAARAQNALGQATGSISAFLGGDAERIEAYRVKIRELRAEIEAARNNPPLAVDFDFAGAEANVQKLEERLARMNAEVVDNLSSSLNVSTEASARIVEALGQVAEASALGPREQAAAMAELRGAILDAAGGGAQLNAEALTLLERLTEAELAALGLSQADIASAIIAAVGPAADLAANLWDATAAQAAFDRGNAVYSGRGGDPRQFMPGGPKPFEPSKEVVEQADVMLGLRSPRRGGGGGGGGADPDIARAKALTESLRTETEKYAASLEEVNRLKEKGLITDETYMRQLDKLNDKLGETGDLGKKAAAAIRSAFDGLFDDPEQALKDLAKQLAQLALYASLAKLFPSVFGSDGLIPLDVKGYAKGGYHSGGLRIVGENGPELEATGPSMIYPSEMLRRIGSGGGGGSMQVNVNNFSGGEVTTQERRGPNGSRIIDIEVGRSIGSGKQDAALRSRFGQRPNVVKR